MPVVLTDAEYKKLLSKSGSRASPKASPKRFKKCPPGQRRNPETNRCKKTAVPKGQPAINMSDIEAARTKVTKRYQAKVKSTAEGEVKEKRPLNAYQQFMSETINILKRTYPEDTPKKRFATAVQLWRENKKDLADME